MTQPRKPLEVGDTVYVRRRISGQDRFREGYVGHVVKVGRKWAEIADKPGVAAGFWGNDFIDVVTLKGKPDARAGHAPVDGYANEAAFHEEMKRRHYWREFHRRNTYRPPDGVTSADILAFAEKCGSAIPVYDPEAKHEVW